jgi:hypothetical protein
VLASDGLWDELTNEQCAAAIAAMGATVGLPKPAARTLQFDGEGGAVDSPQEREAAAALDEMLREEGELTHPSSRLCAPPARRLSHPAPLCRLSDPAPLSRPPVPWPCRWARGARWPLVWPAPPTASRPHRSTKQSLDSSIDLLLAPAADAGSGPRCGKTPSHRRAPLPDARLRARARRHRLSRAQQPGEATL